ncbi:hypothetical protein BYT27DRAFT_7334508 [Phlegmacium glaucopus]|nr:hypothetical protein BYT27DRAFT_7334508 [Phlegmacium glaucopus]
MASMRTSLLTTVTGFLINSSTFLFNLIYRHPIAVPSTFRTWLSYLTRYTISMNCFHSFLGLINNVNYLGLVKQTLIEGFWLL